MIAAGTGLALPRLPGYLRPVISGGRMICDEMVDCEGMLCPLPVLRARKRLLAMVPGQVLCVRATDQMAAVDLPHFCAQDGHEFLGTEAEGAVTLYFIRARK